MLRHLVVVTSGGGLERHRGVIAGWLAEREFDPGLFARRLLYFKGGFFARRLRNVFISTILEPKVVSVDLRFFVLIDRHGLCDPSRLLFCSNSSMSSEETRMRDFMWPRPTLI